MRISDWSSDVCSSDLIAGLDRSVIDAVVIATVVPRALHNLEVLASKYFGQQPVIVGTPGVDLGMRIDLPAPEEVGADRIVNALAAHHLYGGEDRKSTRLNSSH